MILCRNFNVKEIIKNIDDWNRLCPPAGKDKQWKDGRSAKELAKDWTINKGQPLINILNLSKEFLGVNFLIASPEFESKFDNYLGKGRQNDLLILGGNEKGQVLISIEAKADETFEEKIGKYYNKALKNRENNLNTNIPNRIEGLNKNILGNKNIESISELRYQLLHGIAGTIAESKRFGIDRAIFVVSTYQSKDPELFNKKKHDNNSKDLDDFVRCLSKDQINEIKNNELKGPFKFENSQYCSSDLELYILKIETLI